MQALPAPQSIALPTLLLTNLFAHVTMIETHKESEVKIVAFFSTGRKNEEHVMTDLVRTRW